MKLFSHWVASDFQREATEFCLLAQDSYGLALDYTPASLNQLDELIEVHFDPGSADDHAALIVSMGCYVGEVVVRSLGGYWRADEELFRSPAVVIEGRLDTHTFPLARVWRRFEFGSEQALTDYYREVARTLARL